MSGIARLNSQKGTKPSSSKNKLTTIRPKKVSSSNNNENIAQQLTLKLNDFLETPETSHRRGRNGVFYASSLGNDCDRFLYLHYNGLLVEEFINSQKKRIFDHGHSAENRYLRYFEKMKILRGAEVSARRNDPNIHGRVDFILHLDGSRILFELKTINDHGFSQLKEPKREHAIQLQCYLNMLEVEKGIVWYECKNDQRTKAFELNRDQELWDFLLDKCVQISEMGSMPELSNSDDHSKWCPCISIEEKWSGTNV